MASSATSGCSDGQSRYSDVGKRSRSNYCRRIESLDVETLRARLAADEQIADRLLLDGAGGRDRDRKIQF